MVSESEYPRLQIKWRIVELDATTEEILKDTTNTNVISGTGLVMFAEALTTFGASGGTGSRYPWYVVLGSQVGVVPSNTDYKLGLANTHTPLKGSISQNTNQVTYYVRYLPGTAGDGINGITYTEACIYDRCPNETGSGPTYLSGRFINHLAITPNILKDETKLLDFYITVQFST